MMQKKRLQLVALVHLMLAFALIFTIPQRAFMSLILVTILYCATMSLNYCCLLVYMFFTMLDFLQNFDPVGLVI